MSTSMSESTNATVLKFTFKELKALAIMMPKNDVRYYLNGVIVSENMLASTNGHHLTMFTHNDWEESQYQTTPVLLPYTFVNNFVKKIGANKKHHDDIVTLTISKEQFKLELFNESFVEILNNPSSYYNIQMNKNNLCRIVRDNTGLIPEQNKYCFNWEYMKDYQKVGYILTNKKDTSVVLGLANDNISQAQVLFPEYYDKDVNIKAVIMPKKVK